MNEREWNACDDPDKMLRFLQESGKLTERKARLFACACCRRMWSLWDEFKGEQRAVEVAERYADGQATPAALESAGDEAEPVPMGGAGEGGAGHNATRADALEAASVAARLACESQGGIAAYWAERSGTRDQQALKDIRSRAEAAERQHQLFLLRDLFGNPLRPPLPIVPSVLKLNDNTVVRLAEAAYQERELPSGHLSLALLGVLADGLEEAGCTDQEVLGHLRGPGPHVRGCWVVDILTGRK